MTSCSIGGEGCGLNVVNAGYGAIIRFAFGVVGRRAKQHLGENTGWLKSRRSKKRRIIKQGFNIKLICFDLKRLF